MPTHAVEPMLLPTLYRGDSLPKPVLAKDARHRGRTFAEYYVTEGLLAKSADGGRSSDLNRPLEQLVAVHVGHRNTNPRETYAADHSPLISFSTEATAAWYFLDRTEKKSFKPCRFDEATHFMWKLTNASVQLVCPGRYRLEYRASTKNVDRFRDELVWATHAQDPTVLPRALATQIVHDHIKADNRTHIAELIDVRAFLQTIDASRHGIEEELLDRARNFGNKWAEWLLYPMDVEEGLMGYSSRFFLNECLDFHLFAREVGP